MTLLFVGITMWEIWTGGEMPYGRMHNPEVVDKICNQNYKLSQPSRCLDDVYEIMKDCWRTVSLSEHQYYCWAVRMAKINIIAMS